MGERVTIIPTDIPGLVDVVTDSGEEYRELTVGQFRYLVAEKGWYVSDSPAPPPPE